MTLHVWDLASARSLPGMFGAAALAGRRPPPGATFVKLLGTASGETFSPRDTTLRRWVQITEWADGDAAAAWDDSAAARRRASASTGTLRLRLRPVWSRGRWSGHEPFQPDPAAVADGRPLLVLTRARLRPSKAKAFRDAVPAIVGDLPRGADLLLALAVGEAPVGVAGTVTLWRTAAAMEAFARGSAAHRVAIRDTPRQRWYAEELFARFAVEQATGALPGLDAAALA